jgi:mycothiol synthase
MFRLRAPTPADVGGVLRVLQARDVADLGAPEFTLLDLRDQWGASEFVLESDAVLAEDSNGSVIGYATLWNPGALAVVDPEREGEGVGSALLAWAERRAREGGQVVHRQWVAGPNAAGHDLLARAGYRQVRSYWRLFRNLDRDLRPPPPPSGVSIAPVELEADARPLHDSHAAAFATNADYEDQSFAAFRAQHLDAHDFAPTLSRTARRGRTVIGFVLCRRWAPESVGFIDLLGVRASERGRGLGSTLLLGAFAAFAAAGLREAQLGVASDNAGALALYERVGMTPRHRADVLEKPV